MKSGLTIETENSSSVSAVQVSGSCDIDLFNIVPPPRPHHSSVCLPSSKMLVLTLFLTVVSVQVGRYYKIPSATSYVHYIFYLINSSSRILKNQKKQTKKQLIFQGTSFNFYGLFLDHYFYASVFPTIRFDQQDIPNQKIGYFIGENRRGCCTYYAHHYVLQCYQYDRIFDLDKFY